ALAHESHGAGRVSAVEVGGESRGFQDPVQGLGRGEHGTFEICGGGCPNRAKADAASLDLHRDLRPPLLNADRATNLRLCKAPDLEEARERRYRYAGAGDHHLGWSRVRGEE